MTERWHHLHIYCFLWGSEIRSQLLLPMEVTVNCNKVTPLPYPTSLLTSKLEELNSSQKCQVSTLSYAPWIGSLSLPGITSFQPLLPVKERVAGSLVLLQWLEWGFLRSPLEINYPNSSMIFCYLLFLIYFSIQHRACSFLRTIAGIMVFLLCYFHILPKMYTEM